MTRAAGDLLAAVGDTPLVRLRRVVPEGAAEVWVKVEGGNPTGSYKDRMAVTVVQRALERGDVSPGGRLVEYTGGSTGTALAFVASVVGLRFTAVSSDAFAESKLGAMKAYGAELIVEPSGDGRISPELIARMRDRAYRLAEAPDAYYTDQFGSPDVVEGYRPMGREIGAALGAAPDAVIAAVGTGGALMGALAGLADLGMHPDAIALEPAQSPLLTTGRGGPHRVEGVGVGFEPPFLDRSRMREIRAVDQELGFAMCRRLAREEGLLCGASGGLNVVAAVELAREVGPGGRVVTFACDSGMKYLGGHLYAPRA